MASDDIFERVEDGGVARRKVLKSGGALVVGLSALGTLSAAPARASLFLPLALQSGSAPGQCLAPP